MDQNNLDSSNNELMRNILIVVGAIFVIGILWYTFDAKETSNPISGDNFNSSASSTNAQSSDIGKNGGGQISTVLSTSSKYMITIKTNKGDIVFETYDNDAPKTVANFVSLANKGFYNGLIFHRVIKDFMIQGGDPTGTGMGGPGYKFADELDPNTLSAKTGYVRGTVAMANSGPNTNGSQFFIMHKNVPLPHNYTIFGRVVSGIEVVDAIANTATDSNDRPIEKMIMEKVLVSEKK